MENQNYQAAAEPVFDAVAYRMMTNNVIDGLLSLDVNEEAGEVIYNMDGWYSLVDVFGRTIKRKYAVSLIKYVLRTWLMMDEYMIPRNEMNLDLNHICTNPDGTRFAFICTLLIEDKPYTEKFRTFMACLAQVMEGDAEKNKETLYRIMTYVKNVNVDTMNSCYDMVETLLAEQPEPIFQKPQAVKFNPGMLGSKIEAADKAAAQKIADAAKYPKINTYGIAANKEKKDEKPVKEAPKVSGPTLFPLSETSNKAKRGYMIRTKTGERKVLLKNETTIGKSPECDFCVTNTKTVSRVHASVFFEDGEYFIVDHKSTNATFLNGIILDPGEEYTLMDGDKFVLADEEFTFILK